MKTLNLNRILRSLASDALGTKLRPFPGASLGPLAWRLSLTGALFCLGAATVEGATFRWASTSNRIYITGPGIVTLSDVKAALPKAPLSQIAPGVWHLRANLLIEQGAILQVNGAAVGGDADELRLQSNNSSAANSWVWISAEWGGLEFRNTKVTSWDDAAGGPDTEYATYGRAYIRVRSFLDTAGLPTPRESRMDIVNSDVGYLGYNAAESYGLVWKVIGSQNNLYNLVNVYGDIQNSRIHHNYFGVYTYGAYGMLIQNNEFDNNAKYGLDPHDDSDALLIEGNHSHHNGNHGIIASQRCDHLVIRNNLSEYNIGNGIMLHRSSDDGLVESNVSRYNSDSGIAIFDTRRTTIRNNTCLDNGGSAIRFSVGSADNLVENNELAGSDNYGVYAYQGSDPPRPGDDGRPKRNSFGNNFIHDNAKEGLKLGDGDNNTFVGNLFQANGSILRFSRGTNNVLDGNTIPADVTVRTEGTSSSTANTVVRNQPSLLVRIDSYSAVTFEDDNGLVFKPDESGIVNSVSPDGTTLTLNAALIGTSSLVVTRNLSVLPDTGTAGVETTVWNLSGDFNKAWVAYPGSSAQTINYLVGDLAPNTPYDILRNGVVILQSASDSGGTLDFADVPGVTGAVEYEVVQALP